MVPQLSTDPRPSTALMGLRALAPIMIFTSHWTEGLIDNPFYQQQLSIDLFFAVEGFLAASLLEREGQEAPLRRLVGQRVAKIYPLYLLGLLLSLGFAALFAAIGLPLWPADVLRGAVVWNSVLLPSFADPVFVFPLNPPTWAIALEIYVFVLFCALRHRLNLPALVAITGLSAGLCLLLSVLARDPNMGFGPQSYWGGYPRCLFGFFVGVLLHRIVRRWRAVLPHLHPLLIWGAFLGILSLRVHAIGLPLLVTAVPLLVGLAALASEPAWLRRLGQWSGQRAYGLYLLSYPILVGFHGAVASLGLTPQGLGLLAYYLVVLATIVLAAHATVGLPDRVSRFFKGTRPDLLTRRSP
ncbi:hypothetical protein GCM10011390_41410 [Aureimonas endophytica]|uniref:Acyltransferase 3 domain-containing protein n=1 Tax=Aureimonas endophytica TaxID=2027858 RepID=A0A917EAA5_9HYPH|nr:acyltransferase [Aureimonas endophytica]GGE17939.1 hypothetical protein GCM10011390_41410 [Aureimonas endophytica]